MRTIFSLFKTYDNAKEAVDELIGKGFASDEMNVITQDYVAKSHLEVCRRETNIEMSGRTGRGGVHGLDRIVGGKHETNIADVGKVFAAGKFAALLARRDCSPVHSCNELKSALVELEVPDEVAEAYRTGIKEGGVLFWVRSEDGRAPEAASVMRNHKGERIVAH